jgi:hypothetical protein
MGPAPPLRREVAGVELTSPVDDDRRARDSEHFVTAIGRCSGRELHAVASTLADHQGIERIHRLSKGSGPWRSTSALPGGSEPETLAARAGKWRADVALQREGSAAASGWW